MKGLSREDENLLRNLLQSLHLWDTLAVRERVAELYLKTKPALQRGRTKIDLMLASLYAACREMGIPIRHRDFSLMGTSPYRVVRTYKEVCRLLGLRPKPPNPTMYIDLAASELEVDSEVLISAKLLLDKHPELRVGRDPASAAAAALLIASGKRIDVNKLSQAVGVTKPTIKKTVEKLESTLQKKPSNPPAENTPP